MSKDKYKTKKRSKLIHNIKMHKGNVCTGIESSAQCNSTNGKQLNMANTILTMDSVTKIMRRQNNIYHVYKNGAFAMSIYLLQGKIFSLAPDSTINKIVNTLNPKLRTILSKRYHILANKNDTDTEYEYVFNYSNSKINEIPIETSAEKLANEKRIMQTCRIKSRISEYTCSSISSNKVLVNKNNTIYYSIDGLLLNNNDTCHLLSGKQHVLIIEDYFKQNYLTEPIIGELYDAAHSYKNDTCIAINDYIKKGKLSIEFLTELVKTHIREFIELSTLTVFKTGLTYYEKMGYMRTGNIELDREKTYYNLFNLFLDNILKRFELIFMPITEYIKFKGTKSADAGKNIKKDIILIKLLLKELLPKVKFNLVTLHDLYRLIDVSVYPCDFFCLNQDNIPKAMLLYYILRTRISNILDIVMSNLHKGNTQSYKHLQLEPTAENKFIADQHNLIPGIGKEYMSVFLQGAITGSITKAKQSQITEKVSKVLVNLAKLNTEN